MMGFKHRAAMAAMAAALLTVMAVTSCGGDGGVGDGALALSADGLDGASMDPPASSSGPPVMSGATESGEGRETPEPLGDDGAPAFTGTRIMDHYGDGGGFSPLGESLPEEDSERTLTLARGDAFEFDGTVYVVLADELKLRFYTQSSLGAVHEWWSDYVAFWVGDDALAISADGL
ncbi:MAG: hypothetical protein FWE70_06345, partial [Oscillospiraceae bacterium]|nr:hypothetical protein [Oscillospiraceae bacterium]